MGSARRLGIVVALALGMDQPDSRMDIETSKALDRISERIHALGRSLRAEFREGLAKNRRHTEILFENLRDDIRTTRRRICPRQCEARLTPAVAFHSH
jgi:hypothetical protein